MSDEPTTRKRVRRSPGGISVSVLLKGHIKPITFECVARRQEGPFMVFYAQGTGGRTLQRQIASSEIALLEVEEPFVPQYQTQAPQLTSTASQTPPQAPPQPSGPIFSVNPMLAQRRPLRSGISNEGIPMSELEDGSVIPAGFMT